MKDLLIIGARGFGREISLTVPYFIGFQTEFTLKGFLDDKADALDETPGYPPIIDSVEHYVPQENDVFICALGDPNWVHHYAQIIQEKGGKFINLIHRTASISHNTRLGSGCIVLNDVGISCDITIGDFVTFQTRSILGHDVKVGNYCHIGANVFMGGGAIIGDYTTVHPGAIILPHVKVGDQCVVGAGSVVIRKVKDGDTVYGNPAKLL